MSEEVLKIFWCRLYGLIQLQRTLQKTLWPHLASWPLTQALGCCQMCGLLEIWQCWQHEVTSIVMLNSDAEIAASVVALRALFWSFGWTQTLAIMAKPSGCAKNEQGMIGENLSSWQMWHTKNVFRGHSSCTGIAKIKLWSMMWTFTSPS